MTSRLLSALDARIRKTRNPVESACLRAERATLLARQGQLDAARAELGALRTQFDPRPHAVVSAWASLAEGLVAYFENLSSSARDKLMRALALSTAFNATHIRALSAAWLAHVDYADQRFDAMILNLTVVRAAQGTSFNDAICRASLVTAQAYHWADRLDLALPWYARARHYAIEDGDESTLSALIHNMAWLRTVSARRVAMSGGQPPASAQQLLLGAESTENFDQRIGATSLSSLVPILRAHVLALLDEHAEALTLFDEHLEAAFGEGLGRIQCAVLAEVAWCRMRVGDRDRALSEALTSETQIGLCDQPDERAAAHGRLAQLYELAGEVTAASRHRLQAEAEWRTHSANQVRLVEMLAAIETTPAHPSQA
ncbi:MAG TPA: hypothetical protein PKC97_01545 [Burkholderiaceae bacterium]|jgi:hypothetical protein|nr:hypothetical protein [Burkholderiaceae bacterium]